MKKRILIGVLTFGLGFFILQASNAANPIESRSLLDFNFQIPLPGLQTTVAGADVAAGKLLPMYIIAIYNFLIRAAAILAVLMISYAGIRWLTAGGDSSHTTEAKKIMSDALIGLILALGSFTFLSTINSDLINTKIVTPTGIQAADFSLADRTSKDPNDQGACCFILSDRSGAKIAVKTDLAGCKNRASEMLKAKAIQTTPIYFCKAPVDIETVGADKVCWEEDPAQPTKLRFCPTIENISMSITPTPAPTITGDGMCCFNVDMGGTKSGAQTFQSLEDCKKDAPKTALTDIWFCPNVTYDNKVICGDREEGGTPGAPGAWKMSNLCKDASIIKGVK